MRDREKNTRFPGRYDLRSAFFAGLQNLLRQVARVDFADFHPAARHQSRLRNPFGALQRVKARIVPLHRARANQQDVQAVRRRFESQLLRKRRDRVFRRRIRPDPTRRALRRQRTNINDMSFRLKETRRRGLRTGDRPQDVQLPKGVELVERRFENPTAMRSPGGVHQRVEFSELREYNGETLNSFLYKKSYKDENEKNELIDFFKLNADIKYSFRKQRSFNLNGNKLMQIDYYTNFDKSETIEGEDWKYISDNISFSSKNGDEPIDFWLDKHDSRYTVIPFNKDN